MKRLLALLMALMLIALAVPMALGAEAAEKKLVFQMSGEPECMDPTMNDYSSGSYALQSLFRGLYKFAEDGSLVPALAEGYTVSEDGLVYTFTLKKDLKWSDGSPLTAKDFEYSWKRVLNPDLASETAYTLYGVIKNGYECYVDKTKTLDDVGVKALDDLTLEATLIAPAPYFVSMTVSTAFLPVKKEIIDTYGEDWETKAESYVCNGPFMVAEMKPQEKYVFVKNPNYYNASEVKLDKLEYVFLEDSATALLAFENGELNIASSVSADAEAKYMDTPNLMVNDRAGFRYYEFNCANAPVSDAKVRKALSLAIDRKILVENVIQSSLPPLNGFVPHSFPDLVDPSKSWRDVHGDAFKEDVAAAKQLLKDAGYPDGAGFPKIRLLQTSNATLVKTAEAMAQMWKQNLNIDTEIVSVESATYFSDGYARDAGDFEVCYMGYTGDYLDPSSLLYNFESTGSTKSTRWVNADYDAIMTKIRAGAAGEEREKLFEEAEALLANEFPIMPVYSYTSLALVDSNVTGFTRNYIGHPNFEYCDIVAP